MKLWPCRSCCKNSILPWVCAPSSNQAQNEICTTALNKLHINQKSLLLELILKTSHDCTRKTSNVDYWCDNSFFFFLPVTRKSKFQTHVIKVCVHNSLKCLHTGVCKPLQMRECNAQWLRQLFIQEHSCLRSCFAQDSGKQ